MRKIRILILSVCLICLAALVVYLFWPMYGPSGFPKLSRWKRNRIEKAWSESYSSGLYWVESPDKRGDRYYGTYQGYDIFLLGSWDGVAVNCTITVGEQKFGYPQGFGLYAHKNGKIISLKDLYEDGKISDESVAAAAKIHRAYERACSESKGHIPDWATEPTE